VVRISNFTLIKLLLEDSRRPYTELARALGVTEAAVRKRVKKLEELGVIKHYTVEVDPRKLGYEVVCFLGLDASPDKYIHVIEELQKRPEVIRLYSTSGDHGILAECWFRNLEELNKFVKELEKLSGASRICPAIVLQRVK